MAAHPDAELLRRYADDKSEAAFTELVRRRIDLVYSVALRQCGGDTHLAEDVTQKVFVDLARKASLLTSRPVLSGWLYRSTQFAASDTVRAERRRRAREEDTMHPLSPETSAEWERLRPLLDEAMAELDDADRDAIALRFMENHAFADIGAMLQISEDAARKRVDRALDRLRGVLSRRGVDSTAAAFGIVLGNQVTMAAPAELVTSVSAAALASATSAGVPAGGVAAGAAVAAGGAAGGGWWFAVAALAAAAVFGIAAKQTMTVRALHRDIATAVAEQRLEEAEVTRLERDAVTAEQRAQAADADVAQLLAAIKEHESRTGELPNSAVGLALVIDTSGSMRDPATGRLWTVVSRVVRDAIDHDAEATHVVAFDADGRFITPHWIPRTPAALDTLLQALATYDRDTISNPAPGIYRAIGAGLDAEQKIRVHVWVIGDEFVEREATVWARLEALNPADASGHRRATISAVQLPTTLRAPTLPKGEPKMANTGLKFQMLMSEIAKSHDGTYRLLPAEELK